MYNFTSFAMALNELDKEMESVIPKTDCRLRPDIRAMENGEIGNFSYWQRCFYYLVKLRDWRGGREVNSTLKLLNELLE